MSSPLQAKKFIRVSPQGISVTSNVCLCTFKWWHLLFIGIGFFILCSLGRWQWHRAEFKRALLASLKDGEYSQPVSVNDLRQASNVAPWRFRNIALSGQWDNKHHFLIENKFYQSRLGYFVMTPLLIEGLDKVVLVDRGWVARDKSGQTLTALPGASGLVQIKGILDVPKSNPFIGNALVKFGDEITWPVHFLQIDYAQMEQVLGREIYPFVIRLPATSADVFQQSWVPVQMPPERHIGYAVQWFSLAAVLWIVYLCATCQWNRNRND